MKKPKAYDWVKVVSSVLRQLSGMTQEQAEAAAVKLARTRPMLYCPWCGAPTRRRVSKECAAHGALVAMAFGALGQRKAARKRNGQLRRQAASWRDAYERLQRELPPLPIEWIKDEPIPDELRAWLDRARLAIARVPLPQTRRL